MQNWILLIFLTIYKEKGIQLIIDFWDRLPMKNARSVFKVCNIWSGTEEVKSKSGGFLQAFCAIILTLLYFRELCSLWNWRVLRLNRLVSVLANILLFLCSDYPRKRNSESMTGVPKCTMLICCNFRNLPSREATSRGKLRVRCRICHLLIDLWLLSYDYLYMYLPRYMRKGGILLQKEILQITAYFALRS